MNKNNPVTCFYTVNASSSPCDAMAPRPEHLLFTDVKSSAQIDSTLGFVALGAAAAIYVASERQAAGLILSAPFLSMQAMAKKQMPWFPTSLLLQDTYRSDLKIPSVDAPLLILHGDADIVIPHTQSKALFSLHPGDKNYVLIKGGQHNLWNTEMSEHMRAFITTYARPK